MKVVLDTNILISALFWRGAPYKILSGALRKNFELCISKEILNELEEKLITKFNFPLDKTKEYIEIIANIAIITDATIKIDVIKSDPDDNKIVECAVISNADYIVSGDSHILSLKHYKNIKILSSKEFLELI